MNRLRAGFGRAARAALCLLGLAAAAASAADFPEHPVRMVVPYAGGGSADVLGRSIAQEMGRFLGQSVIVDLRPGAGGNLGAEMVARNAAPDGYTILFASVSLATAISFSKLDFDPRKDLVPVAGVATLPSVLLVSAKSPIKSVADLVKASKDGPKNMSFASAGNTTGSHLFGELLKAKAEIDMVHVPYRGSGAAYPDLISGRITTMFDVMGSALGQIKGGQVRAIAITSTKRSDALPDVPTLGELGYPGFDMGTWFGMFAPVGTPPDVLAKLQSAILQTVATPDVTERLRSVMADPIPGPGAEFGKWYLADTERWAKLAREHKIARVE
jgi:tripartite-type tricarboxylate transporter receptor subunit TctC